MSISAEYQMEVHQEHKIFYEWNEDAVWRDHMASRHLVEHLSYIAEQARLEGWDVKTTDDLARCRRQLVGVRKVLKPIAATPVPYKSAILPVQPPKQRKLLLLN